MPSSRPPDSAPETTVDAALSQARDDLRDRLEADLLACRALGRERSWLYAHGNELIDREALNRLRRLVEARIEGRPIAQILGEREFYGRPFRVDERVLIPRPETELLVDLALAAGLGDATRVCDVGTGSGCIALTLAAERPHWSISATDRCEDALTVAADNRRRLGLDRVELLCGDLLEPTGDRVFDLIVSNPPYIARDDHHLARGDLRFEPTAALAAGDDGLDVIRRLLVQASTRLAEGGRLMIEHGHDQADTVRTLMFEAGFDGIESHRDLAGIERVSAGRRS